MSNRHLPAGQTIPIPGGGTGIPSGDMGPGHGGGGGGSGGGPRRRPPHAFTPQYHPPVGHYNYMPYGGQYFPHLPPQYQNGTLPAAGYMPYQQPYGRSPPSMQQYVPMVGVSVQQPFARLSPNSPALSTPYQPPPVPAPVLPQTPSSTHSSSQVVPAPATPPHSQLAEVVPFTAPAPQPETSPVLARQPFRPPLPWLSRPELFWPAALPKSRRRRRILADGPELVGRPVEQYEGTDEIASRTSSHTADTDLLVKQTAPADSTPKPTPPNAGLPRSTTPSSLDNPSEGTSTSPTTPSSANPAPTTNASVTPTNINKGPSRATLPAIPLVPAVPRPSSKEARPNVEPAQLAERQEPESTSLNVAQPSTNADGTGLQELEGQENIDAAAVPEVAPAKPKLWTGLFTESGRSGTSKIHPGANVHASGTTTPRSVPGPGVLAPRNGGRGLPKENAEAIIEALRSYRLGSSETYAFVEPRGLINGGNMCYMNSVLQVLLFCNPFYDFLDQISRRATHSFKSETPLIDAMIMFMREFRVIASAPSSTKLREAIGGKEKQYGEPFTPGFLYDEMKKSKWLANLEQGHQQDAEEFLGLLLQALDDECLRAIGAPVAMIPSAAGSSIAAPAQSKEAGEANDVWLEVGPRQRATITRTSGQNSTSPIAKIFGGLLRSELMVPGRQASVTTEPYQPLQLDIGSPHIRNILDALRGLTSREKLNGDFNSPRGGNVIATKQIHIDELPPVLILHLKRFQFDAEGGTVKVWKKVGYPLELEVPREVLSRQKLNRILAEGAGMPKYRLAAVVYHHGKNASVGHYTVDVRRQDGREWIRIDDTKIDQITSDDVAAAGAEEDPTAEIRKDGNAQGAPANRFGGMDHEDAGDEDGWKQVTASANGNKRWSSVVNGSGRATSAKGKQGQEVINDRKVAYLLFYQRM